MKHRKAKKPIEKFLSKLHNVEKKGDHSWSACCPCHDDNIPSLSIGVIEDGTVFIHCHAGCDYRDILKEIGLTTRDFYPNNREQFTVLRKHTYTDERGNFKYNICKIKYLHSDKPEYRPINMTGIPCNLPEEDRVPYRLNELIKSKKTRTVFIAEGEKDVDNLYMLGLIATCNPFGARKWLESYSEHLKDRKVVILPDNDKTGSEHAIDIAGSLKGIARRVKVLELPDLPPKGDVSDWIEKGGTKSELLKLAKNTEEWKPVEINVNVNVTCSDTWNAEFMSLNFIDIIRYNHSRKGWHVWDGKRWKLDMSEKINEIAKENVKLMYKLFTENNYSRDEKKALLRWALQSEQNRGIINTLSLTKSIPGIAVLETDFDQNPYLLNCINGTYNFQTGELQEHNPDDNLSKIIGVTYNPNAKCPYFLESLEVMFGEDEEIINFIQQAVGLSLTGLTDEEALFFCYGAGENGKSRFFDCMELLMGEYYQKIPAETLMKNRYDNARAYHIATLSGSRFVVASEIDNTQRFDERIIRDITGGDTLNGRFPYGRPFEFLPTHTLWLYGNEEPVTKATDHGFWRRFNEIPFTSRIPKQFRKEKSKVIELYKNELSGILTWAINGYHIYKETGKLVKPKEVINATKKYRNDSDIIKCFLDEKCEIKWNFKSSISEIFSIYENWCRASNEKPLTKINFNRELEKRGFEKFYGAHHKLMWNGIKLIINK